LLLLLLLLKYRVRLLLVLGEVAGVVWWDILWHVLMLERLLVLVLRVLLLPGMLERLLMRDGRLRRLLVLRRRQRRRLLDLLLGAVRLERHRLTPWPVLGARLRGWTSSRTGECVLGSLVRRGRWWLGLGLSRHERVTNRHGAGWAGHGTASHVDRGPGERRRSFCPRGLDGVARMLVHIVRLVAALGLWIVLHLQRHRHRSFGLPRGPLLLLLL
jgi:hypothetical protein